MAPQMKQLLPLYHLMVEGTEQEDLEVTNFKPLPFFLWVSHKTC